MTQAIRKAQIDPTFTEEELEFLSSVFRSELSLWKIDEEKNQVVCLYGATYECYNNEIAQSEFNRLAYTAATKRVLLEYERLKKV